MLRIASQKIARSPYADTIKLLEGNALELPFADGSFDCAAIGFALRNVADIERALSEMARVVRPGGRVLSLEVSRPECGLIRGPFWWYFTRVVPLLGKLVEKETARELALAPYAWLPASLKTFPDKKELAALFRAAGLEDIKLLSFHGGVVALHVGTRVSERRR
jgi:demethylmenaquinone methyltransferase/2-methoxy-6-polyprenyl-1,4-benzoquinol methylase